jgi:transcriptional regulator with XRE-family HTH domain
MTEPAHADGLSDGERLRRRRETLALTQKQLADAAGTSQQHLSFIERGAVEPRNDLKIRLAQALETSVADLFPYPEAVGSS